jgi:hypothetical protein
MLALEEGEKTPPLMVRGIHVSFQLVMQTLMATATHFYALLRTCTCTLVHLDPLMYLVAWLIPSATFSWLDGSSSCWA